MRSELSGSELERLDVETVSVSSSSSQQRASQLSVLLRGVKQIPAAIAAISFLAILHFPGELELDGVPVPAARRCLSLLVCVSILWGTEAIPLYVTSLLVPLLTVGSGALLPPPGPKCADDDAACKAAQFAPYAPHLAAKEICGQFFEPTVLLFLAGFSIGAALEKQRISHMIASILLRPFGNKPENVLLGIMFLGMFMSMWISNIPASVLCVSLSQAIVHQLPTGDPYAKALLLGIAFSNNIGGMTTPIASPQNVIAFGWCEQVGAGLTFGSWLLFSIPFCGILCLIVWVILRVRYPPQVRTIRLDLSRDQGHLTLPQMVTVGVTSATVIAWSFWKPLHLESTFGSMGIVGLLPVIVFFSLGILDRNDFHNALNWSVLILIGGGMALGLVMQRSLLLEIMSAAIQKSLEGASLWTFMAAFALFMALVANFVSSTVAAIIVLPVVAEVGKKVGHAGGMIISAVLMDSAAMALPVSSFPNANSFAVQRRPRSTSDAEEEDIPAKIAQGKAGGGGTFLEAQDFVITGGLVTLVALIQVVTLGYVALYLIDL